MLLIHSCKSVNTAQGEEVQLTFWNAEMPVFKNFPFPSFKMTESRNTFQRQEDLRYSKGTILNPFLNSYYVLHNLWYETITCFILSPSRCRYNCIISHQEQTGCFLSVEGSCLISNWVHAEQRNTNLSFGHYFFFCIYVIYLLFLTDIGRTWGI